MNTTSVAVTAGMGGFLVLFGLMLAVWFLGRDMTRRLRRMRLVEERRLRESEEQQARTPGAAQDDPQDGPDPLG
ncbi:hypothetical protein GCM10009584_16400 [Ornithinimicrobium humiphilum]|uniref:Uncharacterized protein n=1 Tax=Ornithinimicrobium humiphilum TaxID=125288 RepID=A0A543KKW8_9MICO|nr:hypothetical protein [Ornithinimicrobium humiphilum]TQM95733.1 hypothetical protein FB476_0583 [Ornithinimicrobium humiphilum]